MIENPEPEAKVIEDVELSYVTKEDSGKIAIIGINRPAARNAINNVIIQKFEARIQEIRSDPEVRVVIVRSMVPGTFCAGADLKLRFKMVESQVIRFITKVSQLVASLENLPQPVICAVDGLAVGGGLEIALACDIRIAANNAKMGLIETRLAVIPGAGGTQRLPRLVGLAKAKELIFTARIVGGEEAGKIGLANHSVEQNCAGDAAFKRALELAEEILPNGPISVQMAKKAINFGYGTDINHGIRIERECYGHILPTKDREEALLAFQEKRKPKYVGH